MVKVIVLRLLLTEFIKKGAYNRKAAIGMTIPGAIDCAAIDNFLRKTFGYVSEISTVQISGLPG